MAAGLATLSTGRANPGSFYGRDGKGPDAELGTARAAARYADRLQNGIRIAMERGAPPGLFSSASRDIGQAGRVLAEALILEAGLTAEALTADPAVPEPGIASFVRGRCRKAGGAMVQAAGHAADAERVLRKLGGREAGLPNQQFLGRDGGNLKTAAASLAGHLKGDARRRVPATLPMISGHAYIIHTAGLAVTGLRRGCAHVAAIAAIAAIADDAASSRSAGRDTRVVSGQAARALRAAEESFGAACKDISAVYAPLHDATEIIRKAPPGYRCGQCRGTRISPLGGGTCDRCGGSGIDARAMR